MHRGETESQLKLQGKIVGIRTLSNDQRKAIALEYPRRLGHLRVSEPQTLALQMKKKIRTITSPTVITINLLIFHLSLATLLAAWKLTATKASDNAPAGAGGERGQQPK